MSKSTSYKGPRKYEHGRDSAFILSALSDLGQWTTIYSRSRPGSRSNKVFTQEEQLLHLRKGYTDKSKGFQMFEGAFIFAYIGHHAAGTSFKSAIYHWTPDAGWKTGAVPTIPSRSIHPLWKFGSQGSTLYLHVRSADGWLPKIWGWDRQHEHSLIRFTLEEQIKRLQVQLANGGHENCRFDPAKIIQAHIAYREGGSVKNALCWFSPETGWQSGTKPYCPEPAIPTPQLPQMAGKLWMTGPAIKPQTIQPNSHIRLQFQRFCEQFHELWPEAVDRYCDRETGEIPVLVMEAFFWANEARIKKQNLPAINIARIYFGDRQDYLIPRLDNGRIYDPRIFSWPSPDYFKHH